MLLRSSTHEVLNASTKVCSMANSNLRVDVVFLAQFKRPRFTIYRALCEILEGNDRITEAIGCFRRMLSDPTANEGVCDEREEWQLSKWSRSGATEVCLSIQHRFSTAM